MPRIVEDSYLWSLTGSSVGIAGKAYRVRGEAANLSFYFSGTFGSSATGSTAAEGTVQIQATFGSSNGQWVGLGTASTMSHLTPAAVQQFSGPLEWVRPYCSTLALSTETITCRLIGN